ncbi:IS110 family transposase [Roseivirga sp. BDSF3-8]|uniref:IS110 family transposase n=1 Tax=Roseivirga sp. BDSF3-8 TaxID=3241598 RepID=UPI003531B338
MTIIKQCVGIDISQTTFAVCICFLEDTHDHHFSETRHFKNDKSGFNQLLRWVRKQCKSSVETVYLMEATGVYYENLAYHLHKLKQTVHVVLPNTSKHYFSSLNIKTKTDALDAKILSRFGVERKHKIWAPPSPVLLELRNLTRYYVQLQETKTALNNIKHSKEAAYEVQSIILKSNRSLIKTIDKQIQVCKTSIEKLIANEPQLNEKVRKVLTIKGVGLITVATIITETLGFEHFKSIRQVVSYAGYDVVERQSGSSIKGKTRISKKGNRYIRNALYFPAMVSCRFNPSLKSTYLRIIQKKPSKMIGQVAIQRKLLALIYTLWKNDSEYIEGYKKEVASAIKTEATLDSSN